MLGSSWVAAQLAAPQEGFSTVSDMKEINVYTNINDLHETHHAAEDYANRSHKETVADITRFNRVSYFNSSFNRNFNFKIGTRSAVNNLA
jgi:hypothetical protein